VAYSTIPIKIFLAEIIIVKFYKIIQLPEFIIINIPYRFYMAEFNIVNIPYRRFLAEFVLVNIPNIIYLTEFIILYIPNRIYLPELITVNIPVSELCGLSSQCRPNECIFRSGKPWGSGFWVGGYMSRGREIGELVYEQPGNKVDGSCHSKEGSK
jgi:hypothetical protein